jgi:hypothetical protein
VSPFADLPPTWRCVAYAMVVICALGCWWFVARYTSLYKWWRNEIGAHLVVISAALGLLTTYYAVVSVYPELPARSQIRFVLFALLVAAVVWRVIIFERVALQVRRDRAEREAAKGQPDADAGEGAHDGS